MVIKKSTCIFFRFKSKFDVSGETWNISTEAPPSVPLTAVVQLIIFLSHIYAAEMHYIVAAEIKSGSEGPSEYRYAVLCQVPAGRPHWVMPSLHPYAYLGWEDGWERQSKNLCHLD